VGARPRAVTDNLNFGNPHKPDVYFQLRESTLGMAEACRVLETPVVGGNVSLYNESPQGAIFPTPVVGMVGVMEDVSKAIGATFQTTGDPIVLLGRNTNELGASEYLKTIHGRTAGPVPRVDLAAEKALHAAVLAMVDERLLASAHDCAEGGLAVCLAESAVIPIQTPRGFTISLEDDLPVDALLFGEAQGRIVVSCGEASLDRVLELAGAHAVPAQRIGTVGAPGEDAALELRATQTVVRVPAAQLANEYHTAIPRIMAAPAQVGPGAE
jgi:phosphoribosylformylglycinamidine synthase subunit PurL